MVRAAVAAVAIAVVGGCARPGDAPLGSRAAPVPAAQREEARTSAQAESDVPPDPATLPEPEPRAFAVVELFTSEGCSSCPPADRTLSRVAAEAERSGRRIFSLSLHVDYWNYLGWSDPFSSAAYSARQHAYVPALGARGLYTPQAVVNGVDEMVGSNTLRVAASVDRALERPPRAALALAARHSDGSVGVAYRVRAPAGVELVLALVQAHAEVAVHAGENAGRVVVHDNIVRSLEVRPVQSGGKGTWVTALPGDMPVRGASVVGLVSHHRSREVLGAERANVETAGAAE
jgi:hypothetical protein